MFGQLLGSGAGFFLVALAVIVYHHLQEGAPGGGGGGFPGGRPGMPGGMGGGGRNIKARAHLWALRVDVVLMFLGAILMTVTGVGNFIHSAILLPLGAAGAIAWIATLLFVFVAGKFATGLLKRPGKATLTYAFVLPFTLTLPLIGVFGQLAATLLADGNSYAAQALSMLRI